MPRLALIALFLVAACKSAPEARPQPPPEVKAAPVEELKAPPAADDGFRVSYRPQAEGRTVLEVTDPSGADVSIFDGDAQIGHDKAPMSVDATGDKYYRVVIAGREKKLAARSGQVTSVLMIAATGPQPMSKSAFKSLIHELDIQPGDIAKLATLKLALQTNYITSAMGEVILDHLVYRQNKMDAIPIIKDKIVDKDKMFYLIDHFTYREDKAKVQELLSH